MGVSIDNSNPDLSALVSGGSEFTNRIAELKAATDAHNAALAELNLGKSTVEVNAQAQKVLASAKEKRDSDLAALATEVASGRGVLEAWTKQVKDETSALKAEAERMSAQAQDALSAANQSKADADAVLLDAKTNAARIISEAQQHATSIADEAKVAHDQIISDAAGIKAEAESIKEQAAAALASAKATEDDLNAKLSAAILSANAAANNLNARLSAIRAAASAA